MAEMYIKAYRNSNMAPRDMMFVSLGTISTISHTKRLTDAFCITTRDGSLCYTESLATFEIEDVDNVYRFEAKRDAQSDIPIV